MKGKREESRVWLTRAEVAALWIFAAVFLTWVTVIAVRQHLAGRDVEVIRASGRPVSYRIDVNSASAAELMLLPGIGEVRARRIVEWREKRGRFRSIEEVVEAAGLPTSALDRIRSMVTLGAPMEEGRR